jgi:hypothetical protein
MEYRSDRQRIFAGRQHHRFRREGAGFRIVQKHAALNQSDRSGD